MNTRLLRKAGVALAVGVALGTGTAAGFGVASAVSDPSPSATSTPPNAPGPNTPDKPGRPGRGEHRGFPRAHGLLGGRVEHGEVTIKGQDGKPVVWDMQRGTVTAVSSTSLTVRSEDGFTATYVVNGDTNVRIGKDKKAIGDIKTGATVGVAGKKVNGTVTASFVNQR